MQALQDKLYHTTVLMKADLEIPILGLIYTDCNMKHQ